MTTNAIDTTESTTTTESPSRSQHRYFSIKSFMRLILEKETNLECADIYFIPSQSFRNQFNNTSIKPVAMLLKIKDSKPKSLRYQEMIDFLGVLPVISFKTNGERRLYKNQPLQKLVIRNVLKEYNNQTFYDSKIFTVNDTTVIEKIKAELPAQPQSTFIDDIELFE